jgi:hypothetical protein
MGSRTVCYLAIRAVMTVETLAMTTLRVLHEQGKRRYRPFFRKNSTFFSANWDGSWPILLPNFHSLSDKSRSSQKVPPRSGRKSHPSDSFFSSCPSESLRVPDAPSTTCVPAELRLNWVTVARVARMRRFATSRIRAHRRIGAHRPSGQPPQLSDGGTGDWGGFVRGLSARITDNQLTTTGAL